jgi:hypothetical protein
MSAKKQEEARIPEHTVDTKKERKHAETKTPRAKNKEAQKIRAYRKGLV